MQLNPANKFEFEGCEKMKFEDVIYATALVLLCYVLLIIPLNIFLNFNVVLISASQLSAFLLAGLITGCAFAGKLADSRIVSIGKILLIVSTIVVFFVLTSNYMDWTAYKEIYSTTWSASEWNQEMGIMLYKAISLNEAVGLSTTFIGLYVGSILRKPKKQK